MTLTASSDELPFSASPFVVSEVSEFSSLLSEDSGVSRLSPSFFSIVSETSALSPLSQSLSLSFPQEKKIPQAIIRTDSKVAIFITEFIG